MTLSVDEFIVELREAVETSGPSPKDTRTIRLGIRNAKTLERHLQTLNGKASLGPEFSSIGRVIERLEGMLKTRNLAPLIKKAKALTELDDLLEEDQLREVRSLLESAMAIRGQRRSSSSPRRGPLPFSVKAECEECGKLLVGMRGGVIRWLRVEQALASHEKDVHGNVIDPAAEFFPVLEKLNSGRDEGRVGRYLFSKV